MKVGIEKKLTEDGSGILYMDVVMSFEPEVVASQLAGRHEYLMVLTVGVLPNPVQLKASIVSRVGTGHLLSSFWR